MRKTAITAVLLCLAMVLVGMAKPEYSAAAGKIRYVGCGIVKKAFMAELAKAFTARYGIEVEIAGGGATRGIREVSSGKADMGGTCRHALEVSEEANVKLHHVAWDALVVIVNKDNPVDSISLEDLKRVIEGRIKDWGELGGPSGNAVDFYARKGKISGVGLVAREIIFKDPGKEFKAVKFFNSTGPLEKAIAKDKWAIGLTGISSARKSDVKLLKLNGIDMSKRNIANGSYLLYRPLYLVTKPTPDDLVEKFIAFARSGEGQEIISRQETVNVREGGILWRKYRSQ